MPSEKQKKEETGDGLRWLHEEAHRAKAQVGKLEQQVEQLQTLLSQLLDQSHHVDSSLTSLNFQVVGISAAQEGLNQIQTVVGQLQQEREKISAQVEEEARLRQADSERTRQERGELARTVQQVERQVDSLLERQSTADEAARRQQESAAALSLRAEQLGRRLEEIETRIGRNVEAVNRLEQRLPEIESALEGLTRAAEGESERGRLVTDVIRRVESELEEQKRKVQSFNELMGRIELQRVERQRLEGRATQLEETINEMKARAEEQQNILSALDGKHHGYEGRLDVLSGRLEQYRDEMAEYLFKLTQNQQQLKQRQIDDLKREIKELQQHAAGLTREKEQ